MRTVYNGLTFTKALAGTLLFISIDSIALALFESPLIITTLIGYSCIVTATRSVVAKLCAALAVFLVAFLQGSFSWHLAVALVGLWLFVLFTRRVVRYNFLVRCVVTLLFLIACEPLKSWSVAKVLLNGLWLLFGLTFFA